MAAVPFLLTCTRKLLQIKCVLRLWDWNNLTKPRYVGLYMAGIKQEY